MMKIVVTCSPTLLNTFTDKPNHMILLRKGQSMCDPCWCWSHSATIKFQYYIMLKDTYVLQHYSICLSESLCCVDKKIFCPPTYWRPLRISSNAHTPGVHVSLTHSSLRTNCKSDSTAFSHPPITLLALCFCHVEILINHY